MTLKYKPTIAYHPRRKLYYIYEIDPLTDKRKWLRFDTFVHGLLYETKYKFANSKDLKRVYDRDRIKRIFDRFGARTRWY